MKRFWLSAALLILPLSLNAQTAQEKGLAIAQEMETRDRGWDNETADINMVLRNAHGQESTRANRMKLLEVDGDGDKTLIIFDSPRDIKGTAFLTYSHATVPDQQWMYLPALKRVKRISSANKSGPFLGSEFAYEDISSEEVDKYTYNYLRDEVVDGREAFVKERYPQYKHSGYSRQIIWISKEFYKPVKVEFYDRKNALLKTLVYSGYSQYLDQYWRPSKMEMFNHQTKKSTSLNWNNYQFQVGLTERDFDKNSLKRAR